MDLLKKYHPMETDPKLSAEEKILKIEEWYCKQEENFVKEKITRAKVQDCISHSNFGLRNDFPKFLKIAKKHDLHFLVVTGGFSDVTATILNNLVDVEDYDNLEIYGNEMVFDENDLLVATEMKINPVGKRLTITDEKIGNRKNILLFGDITADVNMVENVSKEGLNVISVGFLNKIKNFHEDLKRFLQVYDVVIVNDGGWGEPVKILKKITFEGKDADE